MTRRSKATARRVQTKRMPWGEPFDRLFRLASSDWTPPAEVLIRMGSRTWSYVADFRDKDGLAFRAVIRIDPCAKTVLDERLELRFSLKGKS